MICNYVKSEAGNVIVVSHGYNLIINIQGVGTYIVVNPDNPGIFAPNVKQIEASDSDTLDGILKKTTEK